MSQEVLPFDAPDIVKPGHEPMLFSA